MKVGVNKLQNNSKLELMMTETDTTNVGNNLRWDEKAETLVRYLDRVKVITEVYDCEDALDETAMRNFPTKSE